MTSAKGMASRLDKVAPSATAEIFRRVGELRARGVPIVSLSVGEPDFEPPLHIREAAKRALDQGPFGYTQVAGLQALREAICARSLARRGVAHEPNEVVVSAGAKHALFNVATALYEPGDEVIIPTPSWVSYAEQVTLAGAVPVLVPCSDEQRFLLTPSALRGAITARSKALILCSPSNPTGMSYDEHQLRELAAVLREHPLWVVVDEIYAELFYGAGAAPSLLTVAPDLRECIVIIDGVSKTYAMTGFRVGWMLASRTLARACETLQSQMTTSIATVAQLATIAALRGDQTCVDTMRAAYTERRARILAGLRAIDGIEVAMPDGAFYAFADVRRVLGKSLDGVRVETDLDLARALLEQEQVAVVPGSAFGGPGYLRLSYAASLEDIDTAVSRLQALASRLR